MTVGSQGQRCQHASLWWVQARISVNAASFNESLAVKTTYAGVSGMPSGVVVCTVAQTFRPSSWQWAHWQAVNICWPCRGTTASAVSWPSAPLPGHAWGHSQLGARPGLLSSLPLGKLSTTQSVIWHLGRGVRKCFHWDEFHECGHACFRFAWRPALRIQSRFRDWKHGPTTTICRYRICHKSKDWILAKKVFSLILQNKSFLHVSESLAVHRKWTPHYKSTMRACSLLQACLTLCDPMDCSPPGSSVHGILQARILEWVAIPHSRGSFQSRDRTHVFYIASGFFTAEPPGKPRKSTILQYKIKVKKVCVPWHHNT